MKGETEATFSPRQDGRTKVQNVANFRSSLDENLFGPFWRGGGVLCVSLRKEIEKGGGKWGRGDCGGSSATQHNCLSDKVLFPS